MHHHLFVTKARQARLAALASMGVAALVVSACGSSSSNSSSSSSASATVSSSTTSASDFANAKSFLDKYTAAPTSIGLNSITLKSKPAPGKTVAVLGTADPNNVKIQQLLTSLAKKAGWNASVISYDPSKPNTFQSAIDTALSKKADYLVEAGIPLTPAQIKQVKDAGAKWVLNSVAPQPAIGDPVILDTDPPAQNALMGKLLADWMIVDSGGKANAVMESVPSYPILKSFSDAFQAEVKAQCSTCKTQIVAMTIPQLAAGKIPASMVTALKKDSGANYMVFDVGPFALGVDAALKGAGLSGKVKLIGEAADEAALAGIRNGSQAAWTGFDSVYQGYLDLTAMFLDSEGSQLPADNQLGMMPTQILTKANAPAAKRWTAPADAEQQFKTLWQLG